MPGERMIGRWFANVVLSLGALLSATAALLASPLAGGTQSFLGRQGLFIVFLLAAAALFLLGLRLPLEARISVAVTVLSILIGVYAIEAVLRLRIASQVYLAARRLGNRYDSRSQLEVIRDLRRGGDEAMPVVFPAHVMRRGDLAFLPLGGISKVTTVHCNETGEYLVYRSDEHGFHNPGGLWERPEIDVALLGDSFAQGNCVGADQDVASVIRRTFPATLSLGVEANGPLLDMAGIEEYLPEVRPRQVVWLFYEGNDLVSDLDLEKASPILPRYLDPGFRQDLPRRQAEIDAFWRGVVQQRLDSKGDEMIQQRWEENMLQGWLRLRTFRQNVGLQLAARRPDFSQVDYPLFRRILSEARDTVSGWGGTLTFAYLPSETSFVDRRFARANEPVREKILQMVSELGIPLLDLRPLFEHEKERDSLYAFRGAHLSPKGYEKVGLAISQALKERRTR
jgi:hypothetical protein